MGNGTKSASDFYGADYLISWSVVLVITAMLALGVGCGKSPDDVSDIEKSDAENNVPILRVGHVGHDHHLALYVAALKGPQLGSSDGVYLKMLRKAEVYDLMRGDQTIARLNFVKIGGGSAMPTAMARGEIDIGLGGVMPIAKLADKGSKIRIIAPLQTDGDMLVMRKDIACESWNDFVTLAKAADRPLRIGYKAPTAVAKLIFQRALAAESIPCGLDPGESGIKVLLINMNSEGGWPPLMEKAAIDGFVINQPSPAIAEYKGLGRIVCDLSDLPPNGVWKGHPCCCVAASTQTLESQTDAVKTFLELIHIATHKIMHDRDMAIAAASEWTGNDIAIEQVSVPTINYICEPTEAWMQGMRTWLDMVEQLNLFNGKFAEATPDEILAELCDLELCSQISAAMTTHLQADK